MKGYTSTDLKNVQLPGTPYSLSWKATVGNTNEPYAFFAVQVGYISPSSDVDTICVYNGDLGTYNDGTHGVLPVICPVYFYAPGEMVAIRGLRIATSGYDIKGAYFVTTSSIPLLLFGGLQ